MKKASYHTVFIGLQLVAKNSSIKWRMGVKTMDSLTVFNQEVLAWMTAMQWLINVSIALFLVILLWCLEGRIFRFLLARASRTNSMWDNCIIQALHTPIRFVIVSVGALFIGTTLVDVFTGLQSYEATASVATILISNLFLLWFLVRLIHQIEYALYERPTITRKYSRTTIRAISQVSTIVLVIAVTLNILQPVFGIPISALLAFGGIGGIAVALACQDILANIFGGFLVYSDRPFDIGDWIESPDREIRGVVEHIGLRLTRIRTFDKTLRYVPNSVFSKVTLDNYTRMSHRRIQMTIGIRYDDAKLLQQVVEHLDAMLQKNPMLDNTLPTYARFTDFADSSINIQLYAFTPQVMRLDYLTVMQNIAIETIAIVDALGAEMAFPSRTLYMAHGEPLTNPETVEKI